MNLLDDHALLRLHVGPTGLQSGSDDAGGDYNTTQAANASHGTRRRRKIGKGLQLVLLRKYVQCARQLSRVPDRLTTEQLLEQGYDEFYYQGGDLNEPRLSYAAFLKLVRNRRSEVARQRGSAIPQRGTRRCQKEQMEIRALVDELEHVRQAQSRNAVEFDTLGPSEAVPILSDSSSMIGDTTPDVSGGDLPSGETYSSVVSGPSAGSDDVVISRAKLDLMLRVAQETLIAQKKILEEVRAMEQRVAGIH